MKMNFNITLYYKKSEKPYFGMSKCRHVIIEKFEGVPEKDVPDLLIETLDVPFENGKTGRIAVEPTVERLQKDGLTGFGESWTKRELAREKKAKAVYDKLIEFTNDPRFYGPFELEVDRNTSVAIRLA